MEKLLGNGKPGLVDTLASDISELKAVVLKTRSVLWGIGAAVMLMLALTGSGTISLKSLLQFIKP